MNIISLIKLLVTLASKITEYANNKRLIEAGEAKAILDSIKQADETIAKAKLARDNAHKVDINSDPNNRANR